MDGFGLIAILSILILAILLGRAIYVVRQEKGSQRGTEPGDGETEIVSEYSSGVGGGQYSTYTIPKDPQKYAQMFIPKDKSK